MKDKNTNKGTQFPARLMTVALVLTAVVLVALVWFTFDSYRNATTQQLRNLRIEELRGAILHLDEVLTMSARMAAATGDSDWEQRYRQFEPQLDAAIKEAMLLTAHSDSAEAATQTDAANLRLVEMENQGFTLVRAGEAARAKAILFSDQYAAQKTIYAEGMDKLIQHLREQLNANQRKNQREAILSIMAVTCCIVLLLFTWLSVLRSLNSWRTMQSASLDALTRAEEAMRKLNDDLEKRVEDRTQSLQLEIRERKEAEAEVQQSHKRLRDIFDGLGPSMFVGLLTPQGILIEVNRAPLTAAGLKPEDVLGKPFDETPWWSHSPEAQRQLRAAIARAAHGEASRYDVRTRGVGDQVIDIDFSLQPLRDETGEVVFLIPSASVITERKLSEAALEKTYKQLVEASHRAGMAEVATSVLHNVGNVLNSVNIASSCVADSLRKSKAANLSKVVTLLREHEADLGTFFASDPKGKQLPGYLAQLAAHLAGEQEAALKELAQLQKNIEHIKDIVTMQQGLARASGVTETVNATELVEDALRMNLSGLARHDIQVINEFADTPLVTVEKHKVLQILVNLVRNAKHACEALDLHERKVTIRTTNGEDRVRIAVCDNGVGILPENLIRMFSHGFTTKKDGHGFGLHSAAIAAKEMGGSLTVHSDGLDKGATFTLELPGSPPGEGSRKLEA